MGPVNFAIVINYPFTFFDIYKHILQIIESVYADKILAMVIFS